MFNILKVPNTPSWRLLVEVYLRELGLIFFAELDSQVLTEESQVGVGEHYGGDG